MRALSLALVLLLGCNEAPRATYDAGPYVCTPQVAASTLDLTGVFARETVWDLSGPVQVSPTVGDKTATLALDLLVETIGLPEFLETAAQDVLKAFLREAIARHVNGLFPNELTSGGRYRDDLAATLAAVEVSSVLDVHLGRPECEVNDYGGWPVSQTMTLRMGDREIVVPREELEDPEDGRGLVFDEGLGLLVHSQNRAIVAGGMNISYGALIQLASADLLSVPDVEAYAAELAAQFDCDALAADVEDTQEIIDYFVNDETEIRAYLLRVGDLIVTSCDELRGQVEDHVVPLLHQDIWLDETGWATLFDDDDDGRVDRVVSDREPGGSYRGYDGFWNFDGTGNTPDEPAPVTFTAIRLADDYLTGDAGAAPIDAGDAASAPADAPEAAVPDAGDAAP